MNITEAGSLMEAFTMIRDDEREDPKTQAAAGDDSKGQVRS